MYCWISSRCTQELLVCISQEKLQSVLSQQEKLLGVCLFSPRDRIPLVPLFQKLYLNVVYLLNPSKWVFFLMLRKIYSSIVSGLSRPSRSLFSEGQFVFTASMCRFKVSVEFLQLCYQLFFSELYQTSLDKGQMFMSKYMSYGTEDFLVLLKADILEQGSKVVGSRVVFPKMSAELFSQRSQL